MKIIHPGDDEIQNYLLNNSRNEDLVEHISNCKECSLKADQYKQLFTGIQQQETPAFEFNLTQLVMEQLPPSKPIPLADPYLNRILASAFVLLCLGLIYFLSPFWSIPFLNVTPISAYFISTVVICISGGLLAEMHRKYQSNLGIINSY